MIGRIKRLMVVAGGTGGHIFPALTVVHRLISQEWQVRWLGTANHIEAILVPQYGINIDFIKIRALRSKGFKEQLLALVYILYALKKARTIIRMWKPNVVLGMGGYVSGPGVLAAWSYGIPFVLHEQNSIAGLTNRSLAKIATKVLQAFPGALPNAEVVGNPIRNTVLELPVPELRFRDRKGPIQVLIIGGSQGAQVFNKIMPLVAVKLSGTIILWHQVGKGALEEVKEAYRANSQTQHKIVEFIDDIASAYAWADIVISRAGALTVSEIAAAGLPALFVPFMHKDRQQYWNAHPMEQIGAAKIIEQKTFSVALVSNILANLDRPTLLIMAQRAREIAVFDATERVVKAVESVIRI